MKTSLSTTALICSAFIGITGCSPRIPFTQSIRSQHELKEDELKKIQFYLSHPLVLKRGERSEKEKETSDGTLTIKSGKSIDEIIMKAGTPCIVDKVIDGERISVSFEDDARRTLVFGKDNNYYNRYTLQALEWKDGRGAVNYGDKMYMANTYGQDVFLTFKMKSLNKLDVNQTVVKGKKL
jgi:hypothetical protein